MGKDVFNLKRSLNAATFASAILLVGVVALATSATTFSPKASSVSAILTDRAAIALSPTQGVDPSVSAAASSSAAPPVAVAPLIAAPIGSAHAPAAVQRPSDGERPAQSSSNAVGTATKPSAVQTARPAATTAETPKRTTLHDAEHEVVKPKVRDDGDDGSNNHHSRDGSFRWPTTSFSGLGD